MTTDTNPGFVFVHGSWHNADISISVIARLRERGFVAEALDLPGAGVNARNPVSFGQRPFDPAAFATEPSPNAGVTQEERTAAVLALVERVAARTNGRVVLVGHSLGGVTASSVTEARPDLISAVVYVAAFMLPHGVAAIDVIMDPAMAESETPGVLLADPQAVGALRLDWKSTDPAYVARLQSNFYGDVDEDTYATYASRLHPDEPLSVFLQPSTITPGRFGTVPRYYIRTTEDRTIVPAGQDHMIARVDATMPDATIVHTMHSSHSPFASQPDALTDVLANIDGQSA